MNYISVQELQQYLDTYLNVNQFCEKTINGIQVTNTQPITHIATGVTASLETIQKAVDLKAQALIVHHGIFRQGDQYQLTGTQYKKVKLLIENNIALFCYHLPLDAHQEVGNNFKAAIDLGLTNLQPAFEYSGSLIGVIGDINPISFDTFKQQASNYYNKQPHAVKVIDTIKKVAIVSGSGDTFIMRATQLCADCFITGRVDEPVWDIAHEEQISFLSFGHYTTETIGVKALGKYLENKFNIRHTFIKTNNPF